jgi:hypothetical protein
VPGDAVAVLGLAIMQSAYWYARRLQPQVRFRHRVVLGHVLLCYKRQLASVGDALLEIQPEHAEKATIEPEETGKL